VRVHCNIVFRFLSSFSLKKLLRTPTVVEHEIGFSVPSVVGIIMYMCVIAVYRQNGW